MSGSSSPYGRANSKPIVAVSAMISFGMNPVNEWQPLKLRTLRVAPIDPSFAGSWHGEGIGEGIVVRKQQG